jgi:fibronectin-binding autotransporter adhesin
MIIDSSSPAAVNITDTVSGSGALAVNPAATNGGSVTLSGANTYTGPTSLGSGTLSFNTIANSGGASELGAPSAANGTLTLGPGSLRFTGGTASTDRGYTVNAPNKAAVICVEAGGNLTFGGRIQATSGGQVKTGPGTVRYTYPGPNTLSNYAQNDGLLNVGANGDGPSQGFYSFGVANGRVVLGAPGQTNTIGGRLVVGLYTTTAPGAESAGEFELVDGVSKTTKRAIRPQQRHDNHRASRLSSG